jgi:hypothetical protein
MRFIYIILVLAVIIGVPSAMVGLGTGSVSAAEGAILPEIAKFQVSPTNIDAGSLSTLSWDVRNARSVSIDQGVGELSSSGQIAVRPSYSTTYRLTVINDGGVRTRYVTLYVEPAKTETPGAGNYDPVTGRNAEIDLSWESYCLSGEYQVQIARDQAFTLVMYDSGSMRTADSLMPAFWYPPGNLEAGHTYYWRVRTTRAATGQRILSYWSDIKSFTVSPGYAVRTGNMSVQAFVPVNGCTGCPVKPVSFSWSGYPNTTRYRFILARDPQLQNVVIEALASTTSYAYPGSLEYNTSYFWQVRAVEPVPSDSSAIFTFHTESVLQPGKASATGIPSETPPWAMAVIVTGALMVIIVTILAFRSKRQI